MNTSNQNSDIKDRATSAKSLRTRLDINKKYQTNDFDSWLFRHVRLNPGDHVLDIGCGQGKQTIPFAQMVSPGGMVCAFDISKISVETLQEKVRDNGLNNVHSAVLTMEDFCDSIDNRFPINKFDVIHSTYALYYADDPNETLSQALSLLKPNGKAIIFTPMEPHGMVKFATQFHDIPGRVTDCFSFGRRIIEPIFNDRFTTVKAHIYNNCLKIPSVDEFMALYRATTYYDAASDDQIYQEVKKIINHNRTFDIAKTGILQIGEKLIR